MNETKKLKAMSFRRANPDNDIGLINQYSLKELQPEEVYCFSVVLCDDQIDRDAERFPVETLKKLAPLFVGKTGIMDHQWTSTGQIARIYRTEVVSEQAVTKLVASAYMIRNEQSKPVIDALEGGIMKEVSVGCRISRTACSICREPFEMDRNTWTYKCKNGHQHGLTYNGKQCARDLLDPTDAYEFSFVAVPAQPGAGVTKSMETVEKAFSTLMEGDLRGCKDQIKDLLPKLQKALETDQEQEERAKILKENERFLNNN